MTSQEGGAETSLTFSVPPTFWQLAEDYRSSTGNRHWLSSAWEEMVTLARVKTTEFYLQHTSTHLKNNKVGTDFMSITINYCSYL